MKSNLFLLLLCSFAQLQAQYSYITDRRFFESSDLVGYDFRPGMKEIKAEGEEELDPGEYSFGITQNNLYVKGGDIQGVYNINNIQPAEFGFKLLLMNSRDARLQGHLKVIVNKKNMVESLIFKRSPDEKEIIFYLPALPAKLKEQESSYFTDRGELPVMHKDSIWGKKFYPFLRIHRDAKVQERLRMGDSTLVSFVEEITIEEKEVKKKKPKEQSASADSSAVAAGKEGKKKKSKDQPIVADSLAAASDTAGMEKKIKITKKYFVILRSILRYEDGTSEDKTWKHEVKRVVEKEDAAAGEMEERYQWEFITEKGEKILLYLNGDHSISSFEVGEKQYLMRGF